MGRTSTADAPNRDEPGQRRAEVAPEYLIDVLARVAELRSKLEPLVAFIEEHREDYRHLAVAAHVRRSSGSPEEGSPDRAFRTAPEADVTEADAPQGLSDNAPSFATVPVAAPGSGDMAQTFPEGYRPFDEDIFRTVASGFDEDVVAEATDYLREVAEMDARPPGEYLHELLRSRGMGGYPPRASTPPDSDKLEQLNELLEKYEDAVDAAHGL